MRKTAMILALALLNPYSSGAASTEEKLKACDHAYMSCKALVEKQEQVIEELSDVVVKQREAIRSKDMWYRDPVFWGVVGAVLGVAGGVAIGASK